MSAYGLGLKTPRDFLEKARREIARMAGWSSREEVADAAMNAAIALWSLRDWIANSGLPACVAAVQRIKEENGSAKSNPVKILDEHVTKDRNIVYCRDLANGAKHFELRDDEGLGATTISAVTKPVHIDDIPMKLFTKAKVKVFGSVDIEETTASLMPLVSMSPLPMIYTAKIILDDGTRLRAEDVFRAALRYWEEFFETYKL